MKRLWNWGMDLECPSLKIFLTTIFCMKYLM